MLSPRWIIVLVLAVLGLAVITAAPDGPRTVAARAGDGLVAIVALATGDTSNLNAAKCCKTTSSGAQSQAPGVLTTAAGADDPRLVTGLVRPDDPLRRSNRSPLPELDPPQSGSLA